MPTDILTLQLTDEVTQRFEHPGLTIRPLEASQLEALAGLYLASYPPGIAAADVVEAETEMRETFAGAYGQLREDASASVWRDGELVGAIMVVHHSIWDENLEGPFIIDLFVAPAARGLGAGRALVRHAVSTCSRMGDSAISLRFGEGTSASAMHLYRSMGFTPTLQEA